MPAVHSKDEAKEEQLLTLYRHIALNLVVLTAPFTQRADIFLTFPEFSNSISKVAKAMATLSSTAAAFEFFVNPLCGKLSDAHGRKIFILLGPVVNLLLKFAVFFYPSNLLLSIDRIVASSISTVSGTTCCVAAMSDLYAGKPLSFAKALGGISSWIGLGLIAGPLLGAASTKIFGHPRYAYLTSAIFAIVQIKNALKLKETLDKKNRRQFSMRDANPLSFLKLMRAKRQLLVLSLLAGSLQHIPEGKNLADVHQSFSRRDVGMTDSERTSFVSFLGVCLLINARTSKILLPKLGGRRFTTFANLINHCLSLLWYSTVPLHVKQSWTMFVGALIGCPGWNAHAFTRAAATSHASAAGWGRGEFSGALANMRALTAIIVPLCLGRVYAFTTSGGRNYPGAAYQLVALSGLFTEAIWQMLREEDIEHSTPEAKKGP